MSISDMKLNYFEIGEIGLKLFMRAQFLGLLFVMQVSLLLAAPPNWSIDAEDFSDNSTVVAEVHSNDISVAESGDLLAAFVDGSIRGVAEAILPPPNLNVNYVFLLTIWTNTSEQEVVELQFYKNSNDTIYEIVDPFFTQLDQNQGNAENPVIFSFISCTEDDFGDCCAEPTTVYQDSDGDLLGNPDVAQFACNEQSGWVDNNQDLDDTIYCLSNVVDVCGVCDGDGIAVGECDCDGNVLDCNNVCGGNWVEDQYDGCCESLLDAYVDSDGDGLGTGFAVQVCEIPQGFADNAGDVNDDIFCESNAIDECGVCDGEGIAEGACDCNGNVLDCNGTCGGTWATDDLGECCEILTTYYQDNDGDGFGNPLVSQSLCAGQSGWVLGNNDTNDEVYCETNDVDECGECAGDGIPEGQCDCDGNVLDCNNVCGGTWVEDQYDGCCESFVDAYVDSDGDGLGTGFAVQVCEIPQGYADNGNDVDDEIYCESNYFDDCGVCDGEGEPCLPWFESPTNQSSQLNFQITLDGEYPSVANYVAAFDSDGNCAGIASLSENAGSVYTSDFYVYGDDPSSPIDEGMEEGESITLEFYVLEEDAVLRNYSPELPCTWSNSNGLPLPGCNDGSVIIDFEHIVCQTLNLNANWNLISVWVTPEDTSPEAIFSDLLDSDNLVGVSGFDEVPSSFDPDIPDFLNSLTEIRPQFGYWLKTNVEESIQVCGVAMDEDSAYSFDESWNLISYPRSNNGNLESAVSDFIENGILIGMSGFNEQPVSYDPGLPSFLNSLTLLERGFGYWMKLSESVEDFVFPIPLDRTRSSNIKHSSSERVKNSDITITNRYQFIYGRAENLIPGSQILAMSETGLCVGQIEILTDGYFASTAIFGDDVTTPELDGCLDNEQVHFVYDGMLAEESILFSADMIPSEQVLTFPVLGISDVLPSNIEIIGAFPNPFNPNLNFEYSLNTPSVCKVELFDLHGHLVRTLTDGWHRAGHHHFLLDGSSLASNSYIIRVTDGETVLKKIVTLLK